MRNETAPIVAKIGLYTAWGNPSHMLSHNESIEASLAPEEQDTLKVATPLQLLELGCAAAESARSHAEVIYKPGLTDHDKQVSIEIARKAVDYTRAILSELARRCEVSL